LAVKNQSVWHASHTFLLVIWLAGHTVRFTMKMTMHIDEEVLERVMLITGAKTKTAAVEIALNEMARRHKMKELFSAGLGLTPEELRNVFAPESDPDATSLRHVAESPAPYGKPGPA
jgi:Arc/MetJ family transcription regulator